MTVEELRELFVWDAEKGKIWWRSLYGKREAFVSVQTQGYLYGKIHGKNYLAHRVLWALEYGRWPEINLDHIDQNKKNNALSNLRETDSPQNARNKPAYKNSTSGDTGVSRTRKGRWRSYVGVDYAQRHLGVFDTKEEAVLARRRAQQELGFSPLHGAVAVDGSSAFC